jgi:hypothetical protein
MRGYGTTPNFDRVSDSRSGLGKLISNLHFPYIFEKFLLSRACGDIF